MRETQATLLFTDAPDEPAPPAPELTIQQRFDRFDRKYPEIYAEFVRIAQRLRQVGHERYSADGILHVIRANRDMECAEKGYKINNVFSSRYARKMLAFHPEFEGFFELRTLKSEVST